MNTTCNQFLKRTPLSGLPGLRWLANGFLLAHWAPGVGRLPSGCRDLAPSPAITWKIPSGLRLLCALLLAAAGVVLADNANAGFWTPLANTAPGGGETMLLLSDGTVMAQKAETNAITTTWYRLTPGANGSYTNGTWTTRTSMHYSRLYYASAVLQDGRVFFAGAEYGNGNTTSEVYNPVSDSWSIIPVPAGLINNPVGFADSGSKILADGTVLVFPGNPATPGRTVIFNPFSNTLSLGPSLYRGGDEAEASAVKLPDDSVLVLDSGSTLSERYIPGSGTFINDSSSPVALYDPVA